jgi:hypothetical protein
MAETLMLALATSAGTGAAAAAGSATTATVVTAGASAGATLAGFGSYVGTGLSILSAGSSIFGGQQQAAVYKAQGVQNELAARQEELKGRDQADKIRRSLQSTLASQNAAFASRGISLASGTPVNLGNVSKTEASYDIQTAQFGAGMSAAAERGTGAQNKISAGAAKLSGYGSAATSLYKSGSLL